MRLLRDVTLWQLEGLSFIYVRAISEAGVHPLIAT
jgi:hypothetical protein